MQSGLPVISQFVLLAVLALRCAARWTPVITTGSSRQRAMHFLEQSQLPKTGGACARNRDRQRNTPALCPGLLCLLCPFLLFRYL